jgi:hydroxyacid-oxoacid transhydrogenase
MPNEIAFELAASNIRFGRGVTREVGADIVDLGLRSPIVITDPNLARLDPVRRVLESIEANGLKYRLYDQVRVEPTDESFRQAIAWTNQAISDCIVAVGGGSTIDTAKAINLYTSYPPADFLDYVNPPIGKGKPVPGPLKPLIAVPTTAGTGSETTGVAIFDMTSMHAKTGIAHRRLKPTLGILDPENLRGMPPQVAAAAGLDVLCHAIESYTALPYEQRPLPDRPILRPAYQGSNPISDVWSLHALELTSRYIRRFVADTEDLEAGGQMMLAAAYAGIGFGNAGCHLPHGMSYPVSGNIKSFHMVGYPQDRPLVPHGVSVILNAPAVFEFTESACPDRHQTAAKILGGRTVPDEITRLINDLRLPDGLRGVGYADSDIPALVKGTMPQHRVTKLCPRPFTEDDLARMFERAMRLQ